MLLDWNLVRKTLEHLQVLTNDAKVLREKYHLDLVEQYPDEKKIIDNEKEDTSSVNRFKRLFCQSNKEFSTATARVIQAKSSSVNKVRWAAVDKKRMKTLIADISYLIQKLHEMLNEPTQEEMNRSLQILLQEATQRYADIPDLNYLRDVADSMRRDLRTSTDVDIDAVDKEIDQKFRNLLFYAIKKNELEEVKELLGKGMDVQVPNHVGWSPLIIAAEYGHLPIVELLLERGADPSIGTIGNRLPLHFTSEEGHTEVVRFLLRQARTDPNARDYTGSTAVFKAADKGHFAVLELLLSQPFIHPNPRNDHGFTPLLQALFGKHVSVVRLLLARADVNPNEADTTYNQTALWMAISDESDGLVQLLLERKDLDLNARSRHGETALGRCARQSYNVNMKLLIDMDVDIHIPNEKGQTPLNCATIEKNDEGVAILLAQPNIIQSINTPDTSLTTTPSTAGKNKDTALTPLHHAALTSNLPSLRALLPFAPSHLNLSPLTSPHQNTPLHLACGNGHKVAAKLIINAHQQPKSIIDARNKRGDTPLALAALGGYEPVVRLLLERGADPEAEDEDGETVWERVRDAGARLSDVEKLIREIKGGVNAR